MKALSAITELPGVRWCGVVTAGGHVVSRGVDATTSGALANAAAMTRDLTVMAGLLGHGATDSISARGASSSWVIASKEELLVVVELEPSLPLTGVEQALQSIDVAALRPPPAALVLPLPAPPLAAALAPPLPSVLGTPPQPIPAATPLPSVVAATPLPSVLGTPPQPIPAATPPPLPIGRIGDAGAVGAVGGVGAAGVAGRRSAPALRGSLAELEHRRLRHALARGQTTLATASAARLRDMATDLAAPDAQELVQRLLRAIRRVTAGDGGGALEELQSIAGRFDIDPSLAWAAELWSARAGYATVDGARIAGIHADAAVRAAQGFEAESRAISLLVKGELALVAGDHERAIGVARAARQLLEHVHEPEVADAWLLEAQSYASVGALDDCARAAAAAHERRAGWPPPIRLLVMCALGARGLGDALQVLAPSLRLTPVPPEIERERRTLDHVRAGRIPAGRLFAFLQLAYQPPTADHLRALTHLAADYPNIDEIQETLGWKLLAGGAHVLADPIFQRLAAKDLPDDLRTSVRRALATLAAMRAPAAQDSAAATAPRRRISTAPRPRRLPSVPPPAMPQTSAFSGDLQMFCLPDLLEFLRNGRKSGTLLCTSSAGIGAVHLRNGKLVGANAPKTRAVTEPVGGAPGPQAKAAARAQIQDAIAELLSWTDGEFAFDPTAPAPAPRDPEHAVELDPQAVLLEIFARADEEARPSP